MAAGPTTASTLESLLKRKYDQKKFEILAYKSDATLGKIRKDRNFGGTDARISLGYGDPQGGSADFATAVSGASSNADAGFLVTRKNDYHVAEITGEAIDIANGDANAIYNGLKRVMDGSIRQASAALEIALWGNGGGARGRIASGVGTPTVLLLDITQIVNFEVGMTLYVADGDGSVAADALRNSGASVVVTGVDRDLGTITISGNWTATIAAAVANDYLFRKGDFKSVPAGVDGWIPLTAPGGSDSFYSVNRSADATRLAGCRYVGTGTYEEIIVKSAARLQREGGEHDLTVVNMEEFADIALSLQAKSVYDPVKSRDGAISYASLKYHSPEGDVPIVGSRRVKRGHFFHLSTDTWVLKSAGGAPRILDNDGLTILRSATSDAYQVRIGSRYAFGCEAPAFNLHGTFPTAS